MSGSNPVVKTTLGLAVLCDILIGNVLVCAYTFFIICDQSAVCYS